MKLYYNFSILDNKDFEIDIPEERVSLFLAEITGFTADEIIKEMNSFKRLYQKEIAEHFYLEASKEFETSDEIDEKAIQSALRSAEISKRTRKNFLRREALKKKGMME